MSANGQDDTEVIFWPFVGVNRRKAKCADRWIYGG